MKIEVTKEPCWVTSDGTRFDYKVNAEYYETKYQFKKWLEKYWHNHEITEQEFIELLFKDCSVEVNNE